MESLTESKSGSGFERPRDLHRGAGRPETWWAALGPAGTIKLLVLVGLFAWLYFPHLVRLFNYWLRPDWSHGFLIPLFSLYLVHNKRDELLSGEHRGSVWGAVLVVLSVLAYVASIILKVGYSQPLTMVTLIAGLVLLLRGWRTLWITLFPIGFLILAMPPPERLYRAVTQPLQKVAAAIATQVLNVLPSADVERAGINIAYTMDSGRAGQFTVAGACSGMRSLMAFIALGLAMAYFTPRPAWQRVAMAVLVVPVAVFCNIVRVIVTGGLQMAGYPHLASGTPHTILGLLLFGLGFAIYLGALWILDNLFTDEGPDSEERGGSDEAANTGTA